MGIHCPTIAQCAVEKEKKGPSTNNFNSVFYLFKCLCVAAIAL